jgi:hypothetical protein
MPHLQSSFRIMVMSFLGLAQLSFGWPHDVAVRLIMAFWNHQEKRQSATLRPARASPRRVKKPLLALTYGICILGVQVGRVEVGERTRLILPSGVPLCRFFFLTPQNLPSILFSGVVLYGLVRLGKVASHAWRSEISGDVHGLEAPGPSPLP